MKKLYTGGTFDLFHSGHVNFLKQCKMISDHVTISLNSDEFIEKYKFKKPIISFEERRNVLLSCRYVDAVIENFGNEDSKGPILSIKPNILAIGDDWARKDYYQQMMFTQKWLEDNNIVMVYIPYTKGISSTEIKKRLNGVYS
jgi:glycerol-3-phosphate cytidylyltransferase